MSFLKHFIYKNWGKISNLNFKSRVDLPKTFESKKVLFPIQLSQGLRGKLLCKKFLNGIYHIPSIAAGIASAIKEFMGSLSVK